MKIRRDACITLTVLCLALLCFGISRSSGMSRTVGMIVVTNSTQFFDVKRKDFWQMFVHHMITLLLLSLSWVCNLHRVGSLVLVVHDCADIFLEVCILLFK